MTKQLFALTALAAAFCAPASAITLDSASTQGATVVTDFTGTSLVSFDIDFANLAPAVLAFRIDGSDFTAPISFNAVLRNFTGSGLGGYSFALDKGSFAGIGTVTPQFGGTANVVAAGGNASLSFSALQFLDVEIGNALGSTAGAMDWTLTNLAPGDRFTLTIAAVTPVPEPGTYALLLAGLAAVGFVARRRA